jgi:peptidyl-Lys metalloendopeptidase
LSQAQLHTTLTRESGYEVEFNIENLSEDVVFVLKYNTPLDDSILANIFEVSVKGQTVDYLGVAARRAEPTIRDYVPLKPRQSISRTVDLAPLYDFSLQGEYTIQLNTILSYFSNNAEKTEHLISEPVTLFASEWTAPVIPMIGDLNSTYIGCTANQQSLASSGETTGRSQVNSATNYMQANRCNGAYVTWFGTVASNRWQSVTNGFVSSRTAFANSRFRINCGGPNCGTNVIAYVYPTDTQLNIYVCSIFFNQATAARGETLVHEVSHFRSIWGTGDVTYGRANCQNLARSEPARAITNADNVCFFAGANHGC